MLLRHCIALFPSFLWSFMFSRFCKYSDMLSSNLPVILYPQEWRSDWRTGMIVTGGWRWLWTECGERSATWTGTGTTPRFCADSSVTSTENQSKYRDKVSFFNFGEHKFFMFYGAIDTPIFNFWWCLPWVSRPRWIPSLAGFVACMQQIHSDSPLVQHLLTSWWPDGSRAVSSTYLHLRTNKVSYNNLLSSVELDCSGKLPFL